MMRLIAIGLMVSMHLGGAWMLGQHGTIGSMGFWVIPLHIGMTALTLGILFVFPARARAAPFILLVSVVARALVWPMTPSDDVNRYAWEGRLLNHAVNPYVVPPSSDTLVDLRDASWADINHPDKTAIYGPAALVLFAGLERISANPYFFKAVMVGADLTAIGLLLALLRVYQRQSKWALLYAIHPLTLLSFAGKGHLDALIIVGLLAVLWAYKHAKWTIMYTALAFTVLIKWPILLVLPFIMICRNVRKAWLVPVILLLPFFFFQPWPEMFTTLTVFGRDMMFNAGVQGLLRAWLAPGLASIVSLLLLAVSVASIRISTPRPAEAMLAGLACALLLSGTVHFWYLTLLLPLLCLQPNRSLILWTGTIAFSFMAQVYDFNNGVWREWFPGTWLQYAPVFLLLMWDLRRRYRPSTEDSRIRAPLRSISVVVPALNETTVLPFLMESLKVSSTRPVEVVVADGGSTDDTQSVAAACGARVVRSFRGRGRQIATGIASTTGDLIVIAHADTEFSPGVLDDLLAVVNKTGRRGGCLGCAFDPPSFSLKIVSALNRIRAQWLGISFGDQVQFIRRDALAEIGGFPDLPLMEDVEFSLRLRELEAPLYLDMPVHASSRSWIEEHATRRGWMIIRLVAAYIWRRNTCGNAVHISDMYETYYGRQIAIAPQGS